MLLLLLEKRKIKSDLMGKLDKGIKTENETTVCKCEYLGNTEIWFNI